MLLCFRFQPAVVTYSEGSISARVSCARSSLRGDLRERQQEMKLLLLRNALIIPAQCISDFGVNATGLVIGAEPFKSRRQPAQI
jgi:hypothetical protein